MDLEKIYFNAFSLTGLFGPQRFARLMKNFKSLKNAWEGSGEKLEAVFARGETSLQTKELIEQFEKKREKINPEKEFKKLADEEIELLTIKDKNYPLRLKEIPQAPALLYIKGNLDPKDELAIAIVGTRRLSQYGDTTARKLSEKLAEAGLTIVSGLALGIDASAHEAALSAGGRTIAVLGSGLDEAHLYPKENLKLAKKIAKNGALISEFPLGTGAWPQNFPLRNRIISGLSKGVIVVEAKAKSGALITADIALEQNRDVFAVPGSIFSENSIGPNSLIKMGAKLVREANDVLEEYGLENPEQKQKKSLNELEKKILEFMNEPTHIDEIIKKGERSVNEIITSLVLMELNGYIKNIGGDIYMVI